MNIARMYDGRRGSELLNIVNSSRVTFPWILNSGRGSTVKQWDGHTLRTIDTIDGQGIGIKDGKIDLQTIDMLARKYPNLVVIEQ